VVGRIRARIVRAGGFFGRSEGLQGFGWIWLWQIFFHKFFSAIFFVQKTVKKGVFYYILCFQSVFGGAGHN